MKYIVAIFIITLLSMTALALHDSSGFGGYTGDPGRERRADDPYSRQQYFGEGYLRDFANFGAKGPNYRITNTGSKGAFSGIFNLDTNTFTNQGRNPGRISNFDPNIRGFSRVDSVVDLLPFEGPNLEIAGNSALAKGTARIISVSDGYGSGLNKASPSSQIYLQAINLPPIDVDQIFEAWLVDEDTGYSLSLGKLTPGAKLTGQLMVELPRRVAGFDSVMVTLEDYPDVDPRPNEVVLMGDFVEGRTLLSTSPSQAEAWLR